MKERETYYSAEVLSALVSCGVGYFKFCQKTDTISIKFEKQSKTFIIPNERIKKAVVSCKVVYSNWYYASLPKPMLFQKKVSLFRQALSPIIEEIKNESTR